MMLSKTLFNLLVLATPLVNADNLNFSSSISQPVKFHASVDPIFIKQTVLKASLYRLSKDLKDDSNPAWIEGPPSENMTALATYWTEHYDWFKIQDQINGNFSHYAFTVPPIQNSKFQHEVPLHFVHERSDDHDAIPILLLHGWPSSHLEWEKVIKPLVSTTNTTAQRFHVVAPDLPGFGFSPAPEYSGLGPNEMGLVFDSLMHKLGYAKYGVVSTDLGWYVGMWMAGSVGESLIGHLTDFFITPPNATDLERLAQNQTTDEETAYISSFNAWFGFHSAYSTMNSQNPLLVGQAMSDTPVGFAGYIWNLMFAASDGYQYTFDELITSTMMLWIPGTFGNIRSYREFMTPENSNFPLTKIPTGVTQWAGPNTPDQRIKYFFSSPRDWLSRIANITYLSIHPKGGHFPAVAQPEPWIQDVQTFFTKYVGI